MIFGHFSGWNRTSFTFATPHNLREKHHEGLVLWASITCGFSFCLTYLAGVSVDTNATPTDFLLSPALTREPQQRLVYFLCAEVHFDFVVKPSMSSIVLLFGYKPCIPVHIVFT